MVVKVIIDTNFLLVPVKFHIDIFSEISRLINYESYKILIMEGTLKELENIREGKLALEVLNSQKEAEVLIYKCEKNVDDCIFEFAIKEKENNRVIVCTNDKKLRRRLRENGVEIITLKHNSKIDFE